MDLILDSLVPDLDFLAPDLDFLPADLDFLPSRTPPAPRYGRRARHSGAPLASWLGTRVAEARVPGGPDPYPSREREKSYRPH
jgi:hypothetical protein